MENDIKERKRHILSNFIDSGINITPSMLELVLSLDKPLEKVNLIIKELSFIPSFKSHLTGKVLQQISNEQIKRALERVIIKCDSHITEDVQEIEGALRPQEVELPSKIKASENQVIVSEVTKPFSEDGAQILLPPLDNKPKLSSISTKKKRQIHESSKSSLNFNPIAKEYDLDYEVLKDPTGKLYTNGDYDEFYQLALDKFTKLQKLMRKRPEVFSSTNINSIYRLSSQVEISTMGLIDNLHETKNNNYIFTLEDLTGTISVLVRRDTEDQEVLKLIQRAVNDQMLFVQGVFNPGEKGGGGLIIANNISKIDIPSDFKPNKSPDPVSIALISDTHIGSREFEEAMFKRFIDFLNGRVGDKKTRDIAGTVKYLVINGDLVDGIGVYLNQQEDLTITDIYQQYQKAYDLLADIPDYIKIFYISGNHEPVRNAIPRPAVPKKYCNGLVNLEVTCLGNPSLIKTHNVKLLIYHGESMHDMNRLIHDLDVNHPEQAMKEFIICRHLAPIYGARTQLAPVDKDWLVIDEIPDIFHTGHMHINGVDKYRNVTLINSGCFQAQTDFMKSFGITPTPGLVPIIKLDTLDLFPLIDLKTIG